MRDTKEMKKDRESAQRQAIKNGALGSASYRIH